MISLLLLATALAEPLEEPREPLEESGEAVQYFPNLMLTAAAASAGCVVVGLVFVAVSPVLAPVPAVGALACPAGVSAAVTGQPFARTLGDSTLGFVLGAGVGAGMAVGYIYLDMYGNDLLDLTALTLTATSVFMLQGSVVAGLAQHRETRGWSAVPMVSPEVTGLVMARRF